MIFTSETPLRRLRALAAAVAVTALLAGCGTSDDDAPSDTATSSTTSGVALPVTPVTVAVVDAGAEPRSPLTQDLTGEQSILLTTRSTVTQQIDDQAVQDFSTPELTVPLTAQPADSDSDRTVDLRVGSATSADQRLTEALAAADGSEAGLTVTDTGAVTALSIAPAEAAQDSARAAIEQALNQAVYRSISFPEGDVGVGAVWTADQQVISGLTLNQRTTATLRERNGDRLTIDLRIEQTPESTTLELPDDAGQLAIDSYTMTGTGTLEIDLTKPLPIAGEVTVGGNQQYSDPEGTTVLRQDISDTLRWTTP
ncbi:hypothetical protein [Rhodococcus sovatensis]|uniref:Lipoprotein n=1 Tax=Rhodococcus sovatensis TaxID=1805840 RepID=A0ABZ2PMU3_9NOCA